MISGRPSSLYFKPLSFPVHHRYRHHTLPLPSASFSQLPPFLPLDAPSLIVPRGVALFPLHCIAPSSYVASESAMVPIASPRLDPSARPPGSAASPLPFAPPAIFLTVRADPCISGALLLSAPSIFRVVLPMTHCSHRPATIPVPMPAMSPRLQYYRIPLPRAPRSGFLSRLLCPTSRPPPPRLIFLLLYIDLLSPCPCSESAPIFLSPV